jgi:hypothetical protein
MKGLIQAAAGQDLDPHLDLEAETQREAGLLRRLRRGRARLSRKARLYPSSEGQQMSAISDQERAERSSEAMLRDDHMPPRASA